MQSEEADADLLKQFSLSDNSDKLPPLPTMPGSNGNQELNISTMTGDIEEALKNLELDISEKQTNKTDNYISQRDSLGQVGLGQG